MIENAQLRGRQRRMRASGFSSIGNRNRAKVRQAPTGPDLNAHEATRHHCGGDRKVDLIEAGIEPVDQYAHEFIEKSAIAWFKAYLDKVNAGEIAHEIRGDAEIRQGALINAA